MQMLDIALGVIVFFLLISLVASATVELISTRRRWRGKMLRKAVATALDGGSGRQGGTSEADDDTIVDLLYQHPSIVTLYQGKTPGKTHSDAMPAYIPSDVFAKAALDVVLGLPAEQCGDLLPMFAAEHRCFRHDEDANPERSRAISRAYRALRPSILQTRGHHKESLAAIASMWDAVTQRSTGWYKRKTAVWLAGIGLVLAVALNGDAVLVASRLTADPALRSLTASMATAFVHEQAQRQDTPMTSDPQAMVMQFQAASALTGGWHGDPVLNASSTPAWFATLALKIVGLLVTAIAVSLGAPFWFDILAKVVSIRGALKPASQKPADEAQPSSESAVSQLSMYVATGRVGLDQADIQRFQLLTDVSKAAYFPTDEAARYLQSLNYSVQDIRLFSISDTDTQAIITTIDGRTIVGFRGTEKNLEDFQTDGNIAMAPMEGVQNLAGHSGFLKAYLSARQTMIEALPANATEVHFCGHSLGGALAVLAALDLSLRPSITVASLHTIGQPRVGNRIMVDRLQSTLGLRYTRGVNNCDVVPRVPFSIGPLEYHHAGVLHYFDSKGNLWLQPSWASRLLDATLSHADALPLLKETIADHSADGYVHLYRSLRP